MHYVFSCLTISFHCLALGSKSLLIPVPYTLINFLRWAFRFNLSRRTRSKTQGRRRDDAGTTHRGRRVPLGAGHAVVDDGEVDDTRGRCGCLAGDGASHVRVAVGLQQSLDDVRPSSHHGAVQRHQHLRRGGGACVIRGGQYVTSTSEEGGGWGCVIRGENMSHSVIVFKILAVTQTSG